MFKRREEFNRVLDDFNAAKRRLAPYWYIKLPYKTRMTYRIKSYLGLLRTILCVLAGIGCGDVLAGGLLKDDSLFGFGVCIIIGVSMVALCWLAIWEFVDTDPNEKVWWNYSERHNRKVKALTDLMDRRLAEEQSTQREQAPMMEAFLSLKPTMQELGGRIVLKDRASHNPHKRHYAQVYLQTPQCLAIGSYLEHKRWYFFEEDYRELVQTLMVVEMLAVDSNANFEAFMTKHGIKAELEPEPRRLDPTSDLGA